MHDVDISEPAELKSTRSAAGKGRAGRANDGSAVPLTGRCLIVFVLGGELVNRLQNCPEPRASPPAGIRDAGLTHAELRSMHEVARSTGRDIIAGSTAMVTPRTYLLGLRQLKKLDRSVV